MGIRIGSIEGGWKLKLYTRVSVHASKTNLKHLEKAIQRTKLPVKNKYKNDSIAGIKEWR